MSEKQYIVSSEEDKMWDISAGWQIVIVREGNEGKKIQKWSILTFHLIIKLLFLIFFSKLHH